jgi:hypothetical protein
MQDPLRSRTRTIESIALALGRIGARGRIGGRLVPASPTGGSRAHIRRTSHKGHQTHGRDR